MLIRVANPSDAATLSDFLSRQGWPCHQISTDQIAVLPPADLADVHSRLDASIQAWRSVHPGAGPVGW